MNLFLSILKKYWGFDEFRELQEDIIKSVYEGKDTLGLMPTGGGKSITFQVSALAKDGICLVITPLIALMKDQVENLRARGVKALAIYSGMNRHEIISALENCIYGNYKFLYISPERLDTEIFQTKLRSMNVNLITVDESHCISQWGYDFRPAYLNIANIRTLLPHTPILALTATATPEVVKDIQERLLFRKENVFRTSFERKNLAYVVRKTEDKQGELLHILNNTTGSSIVYVRSRRRTREVSQLLNQHGFTATYYHAGISNIKKDERQQLWMNDKYRIIVATNAFGMGIDKPNVRQVIHLDLPDSPEAYFQEAGRAGRDGNKAYAVLLYAKTDKTALLKRIRDTFPEKEYIKRVYESLQYYYQMAMGDGKGCIYEFNLEEFCVNFKFFPVPVDNALRILTQAGYIEYTDEQESNSRILFRLRRNQLYQLRELSKEAEGIIQVILRSYTGVFTDYVYIQEETIANKTNTDRETVYHLLIYLSKRGIIHYIPRKKTPYIIYTRERIETNNIFIPRSAYEDRKEGYEERINSMIYYASTESICRSRLLLNYFGEHNNNTCKQCDVCLNNIKGEDQITNQQFTMTKQSILDLLVKKSYPPYELANELHLKKEEVLPIIRFLIAENEIHFKDGMLHLPHK